MNENEDCGRLFNSRSRTKEIPRRRQSRSRFKAEADHDRMRESPPVVATQKERVEHFN
jgi:hypothetical protein